MKNWAQPAWSPYGRHPGTDGWPLNTSIGQFIILGVRDPPARWDGEIVHRRAGRLFTLWKTARLFRNLKFFRDAHVGRTMVRPDVEVPATCRVV